MMNLSPNHQLRFSIATVIMFLSKITWQSQCRQKLIGHYRIRSAAWLLSLELEPKKLLFKPSVKTSGNNPRTNFGWVWSRSIPLLDFFGIRCLIFSLFNFLKIILLNHSLGSSWTDVFIELTDIPCLLLLILFWYYLILSSLSCYFSFFSSIFLFYSTSGSFI